jgi:hypothetical protein
MTAMVTLAAMTQYWLAMPTAVITLSRENTMSSTMIWTRMPAKLAAGAPVARSCASPSILAWISRVPL